MVLLVYRETLASELPTGTSTVGKNTKFRGHCLISCSGSISVLGYGPGGL